MTGAERITMERQRQIEQEGWTAEHDKEHTNGELAMAACCYAMPKRLYVKRETGAKESGISYIDPWPFEDMPGVRYRGDWDKRKEFRRGNYPLWPNELSDGQRLDLLIKAGALIAAEIDRLLAAEAAEGK